MKFLLSLLTLTVLTANSSNAIESNFNSFSRLRAPASLDAKAQMLYSEKFESNNLSQEQFEDAYRFTQKIEKSFKHKKSYYPWTILYCGVLSASAAVKGQIAKCYTLDGESYTLTVIGIAAGLGISGGIGVVGFQTLFPKQKEWTYSGVSMEIVWWGGAEFGLFSEGLPETKIHGGSRSKVTKLRMGFVRGGFEVNWLSIKEITIKKDQ